MNHIIDFLRKAFPIRKRPVFLSLCYGVLLVAILWYPLPMLLEYLAPPLWMAYALIGALLGIAFCFFLSGKPLLRNFDTVGWTVIGYLASGMVLAVLFHGNPAGTFPQSGILLISGCLMLIVYFVVSFFLFLRHSKG